MLSECQNEELFKKMYSWLRTRKKMAPLQMVPSNMCPEMGTRLKIGPGVIEGSEDV